VNLTASVATPVGADTVNAQYGREDQFKSRRVAKWVLIAPAILALSLIGNGAWQASHRGTAKTNADKALTEAYAKTPFTIRLPTSAPQNAAMVRVFLDEPDSRQGFQAYQLNVWYRTPGLASAGGGRGVHVWQSNDKFLARRLQDPLAVVGEAEEIGGATWHRVIDDRVVTQVVTTFSRRFDDGVTMTVDSKYPELARQAIVKLSTAPVQLD
jgi:hypothetical protein